METLKLNVMGMSCGHCKNAVTSELMELNGVTEVDVSLEEKRVTVSYDAGKVTPDKIKETITETGYQVI